MITEGTCLYVQISLFGQVKPKIAKVNSN